MNKYTRHSAFMKKVLFLCLVFFTIVLSSMASEPSTHYIIAFDQSVPNYNENFRSPSILSNLDNILEGSYNDETDYVSVVGYTLNCSSPSVEDFVFPYTANGKKILWFRLNGMKLCELFKTWPVSNKGMNGIYASMQSMAKPYAVMETADSVNASFVERTILLLVTDEVVNGADDDYKQEWNRISGIDGANKAKFNELAPSVFSTLKNFNEMFYFNEVNLGKLTRTIIKKNFKEPYQIIPYEVVATNKPSVYSVTDMPSPLPLRRIRGGYRVKVNVGSIDDKYEIKEIVICNAKSDTLLKNDGGELDFFVKSKNIKEGDTLNISMSLLFKDGMYNGTLMSPHNENYASGMFVQQVVHLPEGAKVLGILPLGDWFWWWFPNNVVNAVIVWDLVILLILIVLVGWVLFSCFVRINAYKPDDKSLKITKVE